MKSTFTFRVRYAETDRMGYVYYGNYATYFEVARVEFFRKLGIIYKDLEDHNILLPVSEYNIKYLKPLLYDEEFTVDISLNEIPSGSKIIFDYNIFNSKNEVCTTASTTLFFFDNSSNKPIRCPEEVINALKKFS